MVLGIDREFIHLVDVVEKTETGRIYGRGLKKIALVKWSACDPFLKRCVDRKERLLSGVTWREEIKTKVDRNKRNPFIKPYL